MASAAGCVLSVRPTLTPAQPAPATADDDEDKPGDPIKPLKPMEAIDAAKPAEAAPAEKQSGEQKQPLPPAHVVLKKTADKIVVDGKLDEECWKKAERLPIDILHGKASRVKPAGCGKMTWDDESFYIAFEVIDTDIKAKGDGRDNCDIVPPQDVVEAFVDVNNDDEHFYEFHLNALNGFNDVFIVRPRKESPLYNRLPFRLMFINGWNLDSCQTAVQVDGTVNNSQDQDKGWTGEIKLPFKALKLPTDRSQPKIGDVWRVQLVVQQGDGNDRYFEWSPSYDPWFHHSISTWGRVEFGQ